MSAQQEISFQDWFKYYMSTFWLHSESICGKLVYFFLYLLFFISFQNFCELFSQGENVLLQIFPEKKQQTH